MSPVSKEAFERLLRARLKYLDGDAEIDYDAELRTLGLDSMAALDLLFELEDEFGVVFPEALLVDETFSTAARLYSTVESIAAGTR